VARRHRRAQRRGRRRVSQSTPPHQGAPRQPPRSGASAPPAARGCLEAALPSAAAWSERRPGPRLWRAYRRWAASGAACSGSHVRVRQGMVRCAAHGHRCVCAGDRLLLHPNAPANPSLAPPVSVRVSFGACSPPGSTSCQVSGLWGPPTTTRKSPFDPRQATFLLITSMILPGSIFFLRSFAGVGASIYCLKLNARCKASRLLGTG
jgi:hypothetical protein